MKLFLTTLSIFIISISINAQNTYEYKGGTNWTFFDIITSEDPTSYKSVNFVATRPAKMHDRETKANNGWITPESYIYQLTYDDNIKAEIRIRKKGFSRKDADQLAYKYGRKMGQLPACLRRGVELINILKSDALFGGNRHTKSIEITIGETSELYEKTGNMEETLAHESAHAALDPSYDDKNWIMTRDKDRKYISAYAANNPNREDIAESFLCFIGVNYRKPRISITDTRKIKTTMPNRLKFFERYANDMYPITVMKEGPSGFDQNKFYRLTTAFLGEEKSLDIVNDAKKDKVMMAKSGGYSGQAWKIESVGNGYYRLTTQFLGKEKSLDVINDAKRDKVMMAKSGGYSGQAWKIEPLGNGYYRLTTQFLGEGKSLDIINDAQKNKVKLAKSGNYSGQAWKITEIR